MNKNFIRPSKIHA